MMRTSFFSDLNLLTSIEKESYAITSAISIQVAIICFGLLCCIAICISITFTSRAGSCTSALQLKVNSSRKKFGMICQLLADPAQILSYNSLSVYNKLSAAIHLPIHDPDHAKKSCQKSRLEFST